MKPYMFVILATPNPGSNAAKAVAGGRVHCWVMAEDSETALLVANTYIMKQNWTPREIEHALEIQPGQIPNYHEDEQLLYRKALNYGVAADFLTWTHRPDDLPDGSFLKVPLPKD